MPPRRYALDALADLRRRSAEEAGRDLAAAMRRPRAAARGQRREAAEVRRERHDADARQERDHERGALAQGGLRVEDLAQAGAWESGVAAGHRVLTAEVDRLRAAEKQAVDSEAVARGNLAAREADAKVIEQDRSRWDARERRLVDAKDEEDAAEAFQGGGDRASAFGGRHRQ